MSDVWRAAVSVDSVALVGPAPDPAGDAAVSAARMLTVHDTQNGANFGLEVALIQDFFGGSWEYQTIYYAKIKTGLGGNDPFEFIGSPGASWQQIQDPGTGFPLQIIEAPGSAGASFFGGGTIAVTKDFAGGHLVFETPLGNLTAPFTWFALGNGFNPVVTFDNQPMLGDGMGHRFTRASPVATPQSETQKWFNFFSTKNGVQVFGFALSAGDPGTWTPWIPKVYNGLTVPVTDDAQEAVRTRTRFTWQLSDDTPLARDPDASEFRFVLAPAATFTLDVTEMAPHALTWGAWVPASCTCIRVRKSDQFGASWQETTAVTGTDNLASVSIQTYGGAVVVVYYDATLVQTELTVSQDQGLTWSAPVPVAITGTNPRLVVGPGGEYFFFSVSGGSIVLQRSFDFGATLFDGSPITVATPVPTQDFGAVLAADLSVVVAYADSLGNWVTRRSQDFGLTWITV